MTFTVKTVTEDRVSVEEFVGPIDVYQNTHQEGDEFSTLMDFYKLGSVRDDVTHLIVNPHHNRVVYPENEVFITDSGGNTVMSIRHLE